MGASSRTNSSHRGARQSVRRTSRRRARERVHSRSRRRSPRLRALDPRGPQRDPPTGIASNHGRRHEVPTLSWRLVSRGTSMSTGPILIPPPALDPGERRGPAASLLQLDIRVVAQPLQLGHPPAFEPEAAVLEGIRWLIDQDPLKVATGSSSSALAFAAGPDGVRWAEGAHSGWLSAGPAIRYGVSNPSYMR
jgi:hypothetical protein